MRYYKFIGNEEERYEYDCPKPTIGAIYKGEDRVGGEEVEYFAEKAIRTVRDEWKEVSEEEYQNQFLTKGDGEEYKVGGGEVQVEAEFRDEYKTVSEIFTTKLEKEHAEAIKKAIETYGEIDTKPDKVIPPTVFQQDVRRELEEIEELLVSKNIKYGNSALEPIQVFSRLDAKEGLLIRIDDKLKRIKNGSYLNDDEDVINDLIGYLVLLKINDRNNVESND